MEWKTRHNSLERYRQVRTTSFARIGPKLWNLLPFEIRMESRTDMFKAIWRHICLRNQNVWLGNYMNVRNFIQLLLEALIYSPSAYVSNNMFLLCNANGGPKFILFYFINVITIRCTTEQVSHQLMRCRSCG